MMTHAHVLCRCRWAPLTGLLAACWSLVVAASEPTGMHNPILLQRADPWVYRHSDGTYYLTATVPEWDRIELRRAATLDGLRDAPPTVIWEADAESGLGGRIWAPEIHWIDNAWYIYVAAASRPRSWDVRMWVLKNASPDPFLGGWVNQGRIETPWDSFALDATTFAHRGRRYLVWAQKRPDGAGNSDLWMAAMTNPWTLQGDPIRLTLPDQPWELRSLAVNEGPAVLQRHGKVFITYSANATDRTYCMGLLTADADADLLDPEAWTESPQPVFETSEAHRQYGPGHNSFTRTADGQDVLVYHARPYPEVRHPLRDPNRHMRAQVFGWREDGTPDFGEPVPDSPSPHPFLLSFFRDNGQAGVYLALSEDGYTFTELNDGHPVFTPPDWPDQDLTRDPSILYHDGRFHMVWTTHWQGRIFGYAWSPDLRSWSDPMAVHPFPEDVPLPDQPLNVWAPEIHWDPIQQNYLILFSSTTPRERDDGDSPVAHQLDHRTYAVRMHDGVFGTAQLFIDRDVSLIDPVLRFDPDTAQWAMIIKHELMPEQGGKNFRLALAPPDLTHPPTPAFTPLSSPILGPGSSLRAKEWIEGPSLIRNEGTWMLYGDAYRDHHYSLITSRDLESWQDETDRLSIPAGARHGTVFRAPRAALGFPEAGPGPAPRDGSTREEHGDPSDGE